MCIVRNYYTASLLRSTTQLSSSTSNTRARREEKNLLRPPGKPRSRDHVLNSSLRVLGKKNTAVISTSHLYSGEAIQPAKNKSNFQMSFMAIKRSSVRYNEMLNRRNLPIARRTLSQLLGRPDKQSLGRYSLVKTIIGDFLLPAAARQLPTS